ncbi:MAG: nucleoside 2-deoxyribosyltransferase domain-containing protein [Thermodesulfobacteriota bacterium]
MYYIEAIEESKKTPKPYIFLAGGITNCPDWQQEVRKGLEDLEFSLFNPRRENFPINKPSASYYQIKWEYNRLQLSDLITYWFAKETIQPIVLYELGKFMDSNYDILIGIHPEYPRKQDVEIQTGLARPEFKFVYSLNDHIQQIRDYIINY